MTQAQDICTNALGAILNQDAAQAPATADLNAALSTLIYLMDYWQLDPQTCTGLQSFSFVPYAGDLSITIGADRLVTITSVGTTATVTFTQNHGFVTGDDITIYGATPTAYNGTYLGLVVVTSPTTLTYQFAGGTSPATGTIYASCNIVTQAPPRIEESSYCSLGGVDFLIGFAASEEEYNAIPVKTNQGYPSKCWYVLDTTSGVGRLKMWPASNGATLNIYIRQVPLAGFASMTLTTLLTLPMGLQKPLIDNLAAELLDNYNVPQPMYSQAKKKAADSLRKWKRSNLRINILQMPNGVTTYTSNNYTA